jgi:hypothetical protein
VKKNYPFQQHVLGEPLTGYGRDSSLLEALEKRENPYLSAALS